jgi:hypothetical protein
VGVVSLRPWIIVARCQIPVTPDFDLVFVGLFPSGLGQHDRCRGLEGGCFDVHDGVIMEQIRVKTLLLASCQSWQ